MFTITIEIDDCDGKFGVFTNDDLDEEFTTLAGAYLYAAKRMVEISEDFFRQGMNELQERINRL